jgi:IMP dehydrogenase
LFKEALTFDDVLLMPKYSEVTPNNVSTKSRLIEDIYLNVPFISAAMDTVTEGNMAKAMAREGAVGIIHKNMSIEEQAHQVQLVKRAENGVILDPITISPESPIKEVEMLMREFKIGGLPVVDKTKKLLGIITNRDIRFEKNSNKKTKDLMTPYKDLVIAGSNIGVDKAKEILHENKIEKLPLVDEQNIIVGLITIKDVMSVIEHPFASRDKRGRLISGAAIGTGDGIERVKQLVEANVDFVSIDSAHGHSKNIIDMLKKIKKMFPALPVIAGNIATKQAAKDLIEAGANAIKVGIGPGSICTTRIVAGIGVPQLTAVMDCVELADSYGIPVIADGGIRFSGDVVKALAAGASSVMMGGIFAGTDEAPGESIIYQGRKFKTYRGMGSVGAMSKGSKDRYFQDTVESAEKLVPEGVEGMVAYKGGVKDVVHQLLGGLKAGMGYVGAKNTEDLRKNAEFVKISNAGIRESHAHDIKITKESPNYYSSQN